MSYVYALKAVRPGVEFACNVRAAAPLSRGMENRYKNNPQNSPGMLGRRPVRRHNNGYFESTRTYSASLLIEVIER